QICSDATAPTTSTIRRAASSSVRPDSASECHVQKLSAWRRASTKFARRHAATTYGRPSHIVRGLFTPCSQLAWRMNSLTGSPTRRWRRMRLSRVLQRLVRYFNPVTRFLLATPLHSLMSGRLMLVSFTGRRTGRSYTTPVSYVRVGDSLVVPGGGVWWRNLDGTSQTQVCLRGVWSAVTPEVITEPVAVAELMRRMLALNPALGLPT